MTFERDLIRTVESVPSMTWYAVRGYPSGQAEATTLSVDVDGHPTIWKGEYPLGTGLEAVTLYRAFAQYLFNLDDHRGSRA